MRWCPQCRSTVSILGVLLAVGLAERDRARALVDRSGVRPVKPSSLGDGGHRNQHTFHRFITRRNRAISPGALADVTAVSQLSREREAAARRVRRVFATVITAEYAQYAVQLVYSARAAGATAPWVVFIPSPDSAASPAELGVGSTELAALEAMNAMVRPLEPVPIPKSAKIKRKSFEFSWNKLRLFELTESVLVYLLHTCTCTRTVFICSAAVSILPP